MVIAFVLINSDAGRESNVAEKLEEMEGVRETHTVYGTYDIIAKVEADTREKVKEIVFSKIRMFEEVRSTLTLIVAD